ncbi:hypothetical protein ACFQZQ_03145 [Lysobacter koreensis]|uniref:Cell envelope biogenesis protein TolA n=1 Tax=Lysobacter koreensis TaxID=266122 RepID=A0ABW2YJK2_9GAMM
MNAQLKEAESTEIELLPADALDKPIELFTRVKLDEVIEKIRAAVKIVPDLTTEGGRKAIASTAYKVARSKTAIDAAGRGMVEGWKSQAKVIDGLRKHSWDALETLQAEVRAPLTEWENEQKRIEAEAIEAARLRREAEEAERAADLARREAEIAEREARLAEAEQAEANRLAKIEADRVQAERDEAIRVQAAADAERTAAAAIEQAKQDAIEAESRREREAEEARQATIAAAERAEREQAEAVRQAEARAAEQAAAREAARLAVEQEQREADEKRAANRKHCAAVNNTALVALMKAGLSDEAAKLAVTAIASGKVPAVSIAY